MRKDEKVINPLLYHLILQNVIVIEICWELTFKKNEWNSSDCPIDLSYWVLAYSLLYLDCKDLKTQ